MPQTSKKFAPLAVRSEFFRGDQCLTGFDRMQDRAGGGCHEAGLRLANSRGEFIE
jgi:hypothetical protein